MFGKVMLSNTNGVLYIGQCFQPTKTMLIKKIIKVKIINQNPVLPTDIFLPESRKNISNIGLQIA